jgi:hypothetical protein
VDPYCQSTPIQVSNRSWVERSTGISPTITKFLSAHMFGRIDSIDADIA